MSNPNESPAQVRRDEMNAGFWKAVERIGNAVQGMAAAEGATAAAVNFRLVGEFHGHVVDVPLLKAEEQPFLHSTEETETEVES